MRRLLTETASAAGAVRRYQAVLGVRGRGRRGRFSGRLLVVFERPLERGDPGAVAALRLELFGPVGGPRWTLVAQPGRVRAVVPAERATAEGADIRQFIEPLLGVPVGLEQVAALVVGTGVPIRGAASARPAPRGPSAILEGGEQIWWESAGDGAMQVRRATAAGYEARYPGTLRRERRQVPRTMEIETGPVTATLTVEELRVNAVLHPDSFRLRIPSGFREVGVSELGAAMRLSER